MHRLSRLLLLLYPRSFRRSLGDDALKLLEADLSDAGARGGVPGAVARGRAMADFAFQGLLARADVVGTGAEAWWIGWLQDLRLAIRSSVRRPAFALVSVTSVAIGIGVNATMFAIADTLFLRTIPGTRDGDRIVEVGSTHRGSRGFASWSYPDFLDLRAEAPLAHAALYDTGPVSLSDDQGGEQVMAMFVTTGYFDVMGVELELGRSFAPSEEVAPGGHPVAILSHRAWIDRFEADPEVLGATVRVNREAYTVVGVVGEGFRGHRFGLYPLLYLPITQHQGVRSDPERYFESRNTIWAAVVGRLAPGTEVDGVNAALETIFARVADEHPESNRDRGARAARAGMAPADGRSLMAIAFLTITALALLVLAATCANVAGMLLARASAREQEVAIRAALGSGRIRLVRHLMTEALVVFGVGGAVGVYGATRLLSIDPTGFLPLSIPIELDFALDWRLGLFGVALTGMTGLVFGLLPALQVTRRDLAGTLRDARGVTARSAGRVRNAFVGGQVAVSALLLVTSGLFVRSVIAMSDLSAGLETDGVWTTGFDLAREGYDDPERGRAFVDRLLERIRAMPEVAGATVGSDVPADGGSSGTPVWPDGGSGVDERWIQSHYGRVSDGYFEALGIEVLRGRTPSAEDGPHTERVAVVNETFAREAWPGSEAVGRSIRYGLEPEVYTVIGVVADTKTDMITDRQSPQVFSYLPQDFDADLHLIVRQATPSDDFVRRLRAEILSVDPSLALSLTRSLHELEAIGLLPHRIMAGVGVSLGLLALLLSALGVYGVVAFTVARRTREIGVRIALGAGRSQVLGRVLVGGLALCLPGLGVGGILALGMGWLVGGILPFSPFDPVTYGSVGTVLVIVIAAACLAPAVRASAVQPMEALRVD